MYCADKEKTTVFSLKSFFFLSGSPKFLNLATPEEILAPPRGFEPLTAWLRSDSDCSESRTIPLPWPFPALGSECLVSAPSPNHSGLGSGLTQGSLGLSLNLLALSLRRFHRRLLTANSHVLYQLSYRGAIYPKNCQKFIT